MKIFDEQIARKPDRYPWTQDFIKAAWAGHWTPEEFNFQSDIQNFKTELTHQEQHTVKAALSAIGQVEIAVKKFWSKLGDNLPHPSLVDLGLTLASIEVIHNKAYEKLLDTLQLHDVFEENLKLDVIRGRVNYLRKYLDKNYSDSKKQYVYALILFTLFVENASLFSQFYVIMWMNRYRNVLKDTAQQVTYTKNEECYIDGTEVLTPQGWRLIRDMKVGDEIYQYTDQQTIELTTVTHVVCNDFNGQMIRFAKQGHACVVTPDHDMIYFDSDGRAQKKRAKDLKLHKLIHLPVGGCLSNDIRRSLTAEERLRIAIQADGTNSYWINSEGEKCNRGKAGDFHVIQILKERKKKRLEWILSELGIEYKTSSTPEGMTRYNIKYNHLSDYKRFAWVDLRAVSREWCREFIEECVHWNGYYTESDSRIGYCSAEKENIDKVQAIAILGGYVTSIKRGNESARKSIYRDCYKLSIMEKDLTPHSHAIKKTQEQYVGKVHCVTVPSGAIMTRLNDKTFIAGNCLHALAGIRIIQTIRAEYPKLFDEELEEKVRQEAKEALKAESKLIDWMMGEYRGENLSKELLKEYVKARINESLGQIGFAAAFEVDETLLAQTKWMNEEVMGNAATDFFHQKPTEYSKKHTSFNSDDLFD